MVGATGSVAGKTKPDAVAGWSGPAEMGYLKDGVTRACDFSLNPNACYGQVGDPAIPGSGKGRAGYINCDLVNCAGLWYNASPYTRATASMPPTFIANATNELTPVIEAEQFDDHLALDLGVDTRLCEVVGMFHAGALWDKTCVFPHEELAAATVWNATVRFVDLYVR